MTPRSTTNNDWRSQQCRKCGHEWARRLGISWRCARCDWPPIRAADVAAVDRFIAALLAWVAEQEALRSGAGSWARAQRSMLHYLRAYLRGEGQP